METSMWIRIADNDYICIDDLRRVKAGSRFINGKINHYIMLSKSREEKAYDDYIIMLYYDSDKDMQFDYNEMINMLSNHMIDKCVLKCSHKDYIMGTQI